MTRPDGRRFERFGAPRAWLGGACVALTLLAVVAASLSAGGFARRLDSRYIFLAGRLWTQGSSPYDASVLHAAWREQMEIPARSVFLYPPTVALIAIPVSFFRWQTARWILDALGAACAAACLAACALLLVDGRRERLDSWRLWAGLWLAALVSATPAALFLGQPTPIALLGCLGALLCQRRGRPRAAAAFALLATLKPHVSLFPLLYLLLTGGARPLLAAGAAAALVSVALVAPTAGLGVVDEIAASLAAYGDWGSNAPSRLVGGYHWLGTFTPGLPAHLLLAFGALLLAALVRWRRPERGARGEPERILWLGAPFAWPALFAPLHGYDLSVLLLPVAAVPLLPWRLALLLAPAAALVTRPAAVEGLARRLLAFEFDAASTGLLYAATVVTLWIATRRREAGAG